MQSTELTRGWTLRATGGDTDGRLPDEISATVPGNSHTELLAAGLIMDPFLDGNELDLTWLFGVDWRYRTLLDPAELDLSAPDPDERVDLVFDGIDTLATIRFGGTELGRTANMHRSYRFDVSSLLTGESVELTVDLQSATTFAEGEKERLGYRPGPFPTPFNYLRKMACSFGWDWGPDLRTAGLWKPVRLERWRTARLASVRPLVTVDAKGAGHVDLHIDLERTRSWVGLTLAADILGSHAELDVAGSATGVVLQLDVPDAPLWWPAGYGEHPLADLVLTLSTPGESGGEVTELDRWQRRIGFRTVELDTSPDETGSAFTFKINGTPIFVKGANWIPDDHFLTRITAARLARRLDQALAANLNLLRIWGGGIYETDAFFTACDERGLMVWQDFLLACAAYPEEQPLWDEIEAEARENVVRLMPHPSLIHWNGGNENLWGHQDWGWSERLAGRTWGERYARELLPAIVAELDPTRTYSENSPCSPGPHRAESAGSDVHPNHPDHGTHHQWDVWNRVDYTEYRSEVPRFCSEFGFQGPPARRTLSDWVHTVDGGPLAEAADPKNDANFAIHQKAEDGNGKLDRGMAPHLGVPSDFADWHWAAQLNQARAVAYAVEHYRSWWPRTAGAIVWQLNDCWPVTSWAAIDSEERLKPLWHGLRAAFAPRLLAMVDRNGTLSVAVINDTDADWSDELELTREQLDGTPIASASVAVAVPVRSVHVIAVPAALASPGDARTEVLLARLGHSRTVHTLVEDVDLALDADPISATAIPIEGGYLVQVTARSLARDVTLLPDVAAADAVVDHGLVTLLAGENATFEVRTAAEGIAELLVGEPVLRTANDLRRTETPVPR